MSRTCANCTHSEIDHQLNSGAPVDRPHVCLGTPTKEGRNEPCKCNKFVPLKEDFSQAAARIVKEATKD